MLAGTKGIAESKTIEHKFECSLYHVRIVDYDLEDWYLCTLPGSGLAQTNAPEKQRHSPR